MTDTAAPADPVAVAETVTGDVADAINAVEGLLPTNLQATMTNFLADLDAVEKFIEAHKTQIDAVAAAAEAIKSGAGVFGVAKSLLGTVL